jgi:hypothetical protein
LSFVALVREGNLEVRIDIPGRLRLRWGMQTLGFVFELFSHEESKAPLARVLEESGEGAPKSIKG